MDRKPLSNNIIKEPIKISGSAEALINAINPMITNEKIIGNKRYLEFYRKYDGFKSYRYLSDV